MPTRRGPKTRYTDEQLVGEIRRRIQESPFTGEGQRKVWARLRMAGVRTTKLRVLRRMREHPLLAPPRQPQPLPPKRDEGAYPGVQMWGLDATAAPITATAKSPSSP